MHNGSVIFRMLARFFFSTPTTNNSFFFTLLWNGKLRSGNRPATIYQKRGVALRLKVT